MGPEYARWLLDEIIEELREYMHSIPSEGSRAYTAKMVAEWIANPPAIDRSENQPQQEQRP
jgi:hypothetical protein